MITIFKPEIKDVVEFLSAMQMSASLQVNVIIVRNASKQW